VEHDTPLDAARNLVASRCAHCGGSLPPGAPWCTLCLTRTASPPAPEPSPDPVHDAVDAVAAVAAAPAPAALDPLTAPLELLLAAPTEPGAAGAPSWPCAACSARNAYDATTCGACGSGFLEQVRLSEGPLLVLPLVGDLSRLDKQQSLLLAVAVVAAFVMATLLVGVLLG
jgi:ribosomal protein L40E